LQRVLFGDIHATDFCELNQFAFDHFLSEVDEDVQDVKVAFLESDLKRLHVEPVASEHAAVIAPTRVCGRTAAAGVGAVDDVIVDKRGAVKEFDNRGEFNGTAIIFRTAGGVAMTKKQERRAQALPSPAEQVTGDFGNGLKGGSALA
jgi:hypothetical protein